MIRAAHLAIHRALASLIPSDGSTPYRPADEMHDPEKFFQLHNETAKVSVEKVRRMKLGKIEVLKKRFAFQSPIKTGIANNDTVRGYWFAPLEQNVTASIVFLHGWKAAGLRRLQRVAKHAVAHGAEVFLPAHPFHVWRRPKMTYSGMPLLTPDLNRSLKSMQQAVLDVRSLLSWIQNRNHGPVLLAGVDLGGLVAGLTSTVHPGLDGLLIIGTHDKISEMLWRGNADRGKFREAMKRAGIERQDIDQAWSVLDPGWRKPLVEPSKILIVFGKYDNIASGDCAERLSDRWGDVKTSCHTFAHADFPFFAKPIINEAMDIFGLSN